MRLAFLLVPPLIVAIPFAGCGSSPGDSGDAGADTYIPISNDVSDDFAIDIPVVGDSGTVTNCTLDDADPVGLCVQKAALLDLHEHAFSAMRGVAASWNSTTQLPDIGDGGVVPYTFDDTAAYAAAASDYLSSATDYGDTTLTGTVQSDLTSMAGLIESNNFFPASTEYSGELYFHLRTMAEGLNKIGLMSDASKITTIADNYGRLILTAHYTPLAPIVVGATDASAGGSSDAGHATDAVADADHPSDAVADGGHVSDAVADAEKPLDSGSKGGTSIPDGIIGNPSGTNQIAYATEDVATAAFALLDMASRYQTDPSAPAWLAAARAALNHLRARAIEPTTGMFYTALLTNKSGDGGVADTLAPTTNPTIPSDALLADTQATYALAMIRAQYLVTSTTIVSLSGIDSGGAIHDAGVSGPLVSALDIPFEAWADATMTAMNGAHSLWDGMHGDGGEPGNGYMDGYIPSTGALITTKSTRPNAFMAGAISRALLNKDALLSNQLTSLVQLLIAEYSATVAMNSDFITVIPSQLAFLRGATRSFDPLTTGANPTSYTTAATSAAVEGLTEQLFSATLFF